MTEAEVAPASDVRLREMVPARSCQPELEFPASAREPWLRLGP